MSGVGKSSVVARLRELGYTAVDLDEPGWSETRADGEWVWREDRVADLLAANDADLLFVSGCAENQGRFHERFEHIVLLSAPPGTLVQRLAARTNNPFGKHPSELDEGAPGSGRDSSRSLRRSDDERDRHDGTSRRRGRRGVADRVVTRARRPAQAVRSDAHGSSAVTSTAA